MYGQPNYGSQIGQGPHRPLPPYQQRAVAPPPPPPLNSYFQQSPPIPSHPITQQQTVPSPQVGQPLPHSGSHGPPTLLGQGQSIQVLPGEITNTRQTYLHAFPPVHGSTQMPQFTPNTPQSGHVSHSGIQNMRHISPPPPPLPPPPPPPPPPPLNPDLLRPPQTSTVVPLHPPLHGQTLYGARIHPPFQQGGLQVLHSVPQHPSASTFATPFGGFKQSNLGESHLHYMAPPPPPSSPPPIPPSPPPPPPPIPPSLSSIPNPDSSNLCKCDSHPSPIIYSSQEWNILDSNEGAVTSCHVGEKATKYDKDRNPESDSGLMVDSELDIDRFEDEDKVQDLPPSPPKPKGDKILKNIEVLCQLITNNGSDFEDKTRRNEFGNPEFEFLFGGEPGSEAAIGHKYFLWMKKKYSLACKNKKMKEKSPLRSLRNETNSENLMASAGSISPANSDMEMEDDITPAGVGEEANNSFEIQSFVRKSIGEHDGKVQLQGHEVFQKCSTAKEKVVEDGGPKVLLVPEKSVSNSTPQVHSPVMSTAGIAEWPSGDNFENSVTCLPNDRSLIGALEASDAINSGKSTALVTGGSPFRLLQDYASDENSENNEESPLKDVCFAIAPSTLASTKTSHRDTDDLSIRSKESQKLASDASEANVRSEMGDEQSYDNQRNQTDASTSSSKSLAAKNGHNVGVFHESDKLQKENEEEKSKFESPVKIDEFGRLVREGGSDSDSDDSHYTRRRKHRRTRNSSESHSPVDRRRGRRSPWRRRERRSRSRSWSPRSQRGRSRSPVSRRTSQFINENMRREKGIGRCFDFQRGRCHRGASCRYLHHEPSKNDGSRPHRSKQRHDVHRNSKDIKKEETETMCREVSDLVHNEVKNQDCFHHNVSSKDVSPNWKTDNPNGDPDSDVTKCQSSRDIAGSILEDEIVHSKPAAAIHIHFNENIQGAGESRQKISSECISNAGSEKFSGDISTSSLPSFKNCVVQQPNISVPGLQTADSIAHQMDDSFVSNFLPDQVTEVAPSNSPEHEPFPDKPPSIKPQSDTNSASQPPLSTQSPVPKQLHAPASVPIHSLPELLPPPPPIFSHVSSAEVPIPVPCNFMPKNESFSSHSSLPVGFHPHREFVSFQSSHYPGASFSIPPPKPIYNSTLPPVTTNYSTPMQFQLSHLSQGSDLGSQSQPLELSSYSQFDVSLFKDPYRAPINMGEIRSIAPPLNNRPGQPFGVPNFQKEENFGRTSAELNSSSLFSYGNLNSYSMPLSNELSSNRMQSSGDNFPPSEFRSSFSQFNPYSRFQQPSFASQPAYDSLLRGPGQVGSISRHFPDPLNTNKSSLLPDFGGLGISTYHNPYASTFEKPLSSSFRYNALKLGNDASSGTDCVGSKQTTASPNSTRRVEKLLPSAVGDQYDPLFDSIDPSPIAKKADLGQNLERTRESHMMRRLGGSHKPLDVEENNKHKEVAAVASTASLENDEFGETGDAEAGAVENDPIDEANLSGEIEIDQVKSPGKSKKSKGSRSLRLFRIAIANFVKEVLKPSWRQGNMSKEAFKTIVKKTVDKVSGAMKSHQVPKSQAKINRYIDSSQRKLTKLVMGYVDKYVKA